MTVFKCTYLAGSIQRTVETTLIGCISCAATICPVRDKVQCDATRQDGMCFGLSIIICQRSQVERVGSAIMQIMPGVGNRTVVTRHPDQVVIL